jgi:hypothetical protein
VEAGGAAPAGFGLLGLHAALHAAFWARKYALDIATRRYWQQPTAVWLLVVAAVVASPLLPSASAPARGPFWSAAARACGPR